MVYQHQQMALIPRMGQHDRTLLPNRMKVKVRDILLNPYGVRGLGIPLIPR